MTTLPATSAAIAARLHAEASWTTFIGQRNLTAPLAAWRTEDALDGSPAVTVEITGRGAGHALRRFAVDYYMVLGQAGDVRPQFDVSVPGRTSLVWRSGGIWVELWHPDSAPDIPEAPEPVRPAPAPPAAVQAPSAPEPSGLLSFLMPGGRLPFTRRKKETPTR
jgi:hypothetical protein